MGGKIGYARVSTADQSHDLQMDALNKAGCLRIFVETASGAKTDRPELAKVLDYLRPGDTLVVWKLDRLARTVKQLIETVAALDANGVHFVCTTQAIDTSTPMGKMFFHILAALAEFERDMLRERTNAGVAAARERGRIGGRPKVDAAKVTQALAMVQGGMSVTAAAGAVNISRATLKRRKSGSKAY
jgi:DNA invertase Pin-like site-specific DNA recombinase